MSFTLCDGWHWLFLEEDLKTPFSKRLTFTDESEILELAVRSGCEMKTENRQAFEAAGIALKPMTDAGSGSVQEKEKALLEVNHL